MQHVYLLQEIEAGGIAPTGLYKIGKTTATVEGRKRNYRAGNPRRLDTLHTIQVTDAQAIETTLHRRLSYYRRNYGGGDEWFDFRDVNINSVIEIMNDYAETPAYAVWGSSYSDAYDDSYGDSYEDEDSYGPSFEAFKHSYSGHDHGTDGVWVGIVIVILLVGGAIFGISKHLPDLSIPKPAVVYVPESSGYSAVNLRSAPQLGDQFIIGQLMPGQPVTAYETSPDGQWRRVKLPDGRTGWVFNNALR